jgi:hypothetical protein
VARAVISAAGKTAPRRSAGPDGLASGEHHDDVYSLDRAGIGDGRGAAVEMEGASLGQVAR